MSEKVRYIETLCNDQQRQNMPEFQRGDTVNIHYKIKEGNKERIQQFKGIVIERKNPNTNGETFTVIRHVSGVAQYVERTFPLLSPNIAKIEVISQGDVHQARLFYLRDRRGKAATVKARRRA